MQNLKSTVNYIRQEIGLSMTKRGLVLLLLDGKKMVHEAVSNPSWYVCFDDTKIKPFRLVDTKLNTNKPMSNEAWASTKWKEYKDR